MPLLSNLPTTIPTAGPARDKSEAEKDVRYVEELREQVRVAVARLACVRATWGPTKDVDAAALVGKVLLAEMRLKEGIEWARKMEEARNIEALREQVREAVASLAWVRTAWAERHWVRAAWGPSVDRDEAALVGNVMVAEERLNEAIEWAKKKAEAEARAAEAEAERVAAARAKEAEIRKAEVAAARAKEAEMREAKEAEIREADAWAAEQTRAAGVRFEARRAAMAEAAARAARAARAEAAAAAAAAEAAAALPLGAIPTDGRQGPWKKASVSSLWSILVEKETARFIRNYGRDPTTAEKEDWEITRMQLIAALRSHPELKVSLGLLPEMNINESTGRRNYNYVHRLMSALQKTAAGYTGSAVTYTMWLRLLGAGQVKINELAGLPTAALVQYVCAVLDDVHVEF